MLACFMHPCLLASPNRTGTWHWHWHFTAGVAVDTYYVDSWDMDARHLTSSLGRKEWLTAKGAVQLRSTAGGPRTVVCFSRRAVEPHAVTRQAQVRRREERGARGQHGCRGLTQPLNAAHAARSLPGRAGTARPAALRALHAQRVLRAHRHGPHACMHAWRARLTWGCRAGHVHGMYAGCDIHVHACMYASCRM